MNRIAIITEILKEPLDEGAKNTVFNLLKQLKKNYKCRVFSINGRGRFDFVDLNFNLNKLLFSLHFYKTIMGHCDKVLYIPGSSITLATFLRTRLLQLFTRREVTILALQPITYNMLEKIIIQMIRPQCVIAQSKGTSQRLNKMGIDVRLLSLGVDNTKYREMGQETKKILREKYSIDSNKIVVLHVGHMKSSRNLDWLLHVKSRIPETVVIFVSSTSTRQDEELHRRLVRLGITVINDYIPQIEELYNIADYYLFPVTRNDASIETPLSVLEAMACNLPIITTRFGSLQDVFTEDECFHYARSPDDVIEILKRRSLTECDNRSKIKPFTWDEIAGRLWEILR